MGQGIGVGFSQAMDQVSKEMEGSIPTDFDLNSKLNLKESVNGFDMERETNSIIQHTGVIEVRGINTKNELTGVVEIIMDQFRREARI